jgi:hypothetical protein
MQARVIYWKQYNHTEQGFSLIEIIEDGTILKRSFINHEEYGRYYQETHQESFQAKGEIVVEKISFDEDFRLKKTDIPNNLERLSTYDFNQWETARKEVRKLQKASVDTLHMDYHSVMRLDIASLPEEIKTVLDRYDFPIVKYRVISDGTYLLRKKYPEQLSIEFIPSLNEKLYFHHIPENNHFNMSGDDLFALDVTVSDELGDEEAFWQYIHSMIQNVEKNLKHYRSLINTQRERRAMLETDVIGDLYPR